MGAVAISVALSRKFGRRKGVAKMNRTSMIVLGILALLTVAVLAGCEGGYNDPAVNQADMEGSWTKTNRRVDGVSENPITVPQSYVFNHDGTYTGTDGAALNPRTESGTWEVRDSRLVIHMTTNSWGGPAANGSVAIVLVEANRYGISYSSNIGGGGSVLILETYTRN